MPTPALAALEIALGDVDNLIAHHPKAADPGPGRPSTDEGPLLRSCLLLTYAAWEVYVEDGVIWAVEQVTQQPEPQQLPEALRAFVAAETTRDPWQLAGDRWQETTVATVTKLARGDEQSGKFGINTAGPRQIAAFHDTILGERLLDKCRWNNKFTPTIKKELAKFVEIRSAIAHTGQPLGPLHLDGVRYWKNFIPDLARQLDSHLEAWVEAHLPAGDPP